MLKSLNRPVPLARGIDSGFRWFTQIVALGLVVLTLGIALELGWIAAPAIAHFGLSFLITTVWNPVQDIYGILPPLYGTLVSSLLALGLALPLGISIAILLSDTFLPLSLCISLGMLIDLLAAIPSVVYGLWGIYQLIPRMQPLMQGLHQTLGWLPWFSTVPANRAMLPTVVVLAIMILPILTAVSREAMAAVPLDLRQGAAALGATRWEIILRIWLPAARSGLIGGIILSLGRALGETMAVAMLIGNAHQINLSLLASASTLASLIANQFSEARELQLSALLYAALVLMAVTCILNALAEVLRHPIPGLLRFWNLPNLPKSANPASHHKTHPTSTQKPVSHTTSLVRRGFSLLLTSIATLCTGVTILGLLSILVSLIFNGWQRLDWAAFTELPPPPLDDGGGFRNAIVGTLLTVSIGACLSIPIGILTAIYLVEFGQTRRLASVIRVVNGVLSGIPSIVCGLFAYGVVVLTTGTFSAVAGGVALAVVILPLIVRTTEEGLNAVSDEWRMGAIALGATRVQTISQVVLPGAVPAIATGITLALARAMGETAPLLFTALFSQFGMDGLWNPIATLPVLIYTFALSPYPNYQALAWSAALVIVGLIVLINVSARWLAHHLTPYTRF